MKEALLLLLLVAGPGCHAGRTAQAAGPVEIDAWYLFPGEPAPFEGYLLHPRDLERLLTPERPTEEQ